MGAMARLSGAVFPQMIEDTSLQQKAPPTAVKKTKGCNQLQKD